MKLEHRSLVELLPINAILYNGGWSNDLYTVGAIYKVVASGKEICSLNSNIPGQNFPISIKFLRKIEKEEPEEHFMSENNSITII